MSDCGDLIANFTMSDQDMDDEHVFAAFDMFRESEDKGKQRATSPAKEDARILRMLANDNCGVNASRKVSLMKAEQKASLSAFFKEVDDKMDTLRESLASRPRTLSVQPANFTIDQPSRDLADDFNDIDLDTAPLLEDDSNGDASYVDANIFSDYEDDDDWEMLEKDELKGESQSANISDGVVYQSPSFRGAMQEYVTRYGLSPEQQQSLQGAMAVLKLVGEFGYAVVSEPVLDAAHWAAQRQFGVELDELPKELRSRLFASLPEPVQNTLLIVQHAARVTNRYVSPSNLGCANDQSID